MPQIEPKTVRFNSEEIRSIEHLLGEDGQTLLAELALRHSSPVLKLLPEGNTPTTFSEVVRLLVRVCLREVHDLQLEHQYQRSAEIMAAALPSDLVASMTEVGWSAVKYAHESSVAKGVREGA